MFDGAQPSVALTAISSVSGGSITNTWLGLDAPADGPLTSTDLDTAARQLIPELVGRPAWWRAALIILLLIPAVCPWFLRDQVPNDGARFLVCTVAAIVTATVVGVHSGDLLFGWWGAWLYLGILVAAFVGTVWIWFLPAGTASRLGWSLVALFGTALIALFRPLIVQAALNRRFTRLNGGSTPRAVDLGTGTSHIICITELAGKNMLYAGSDLVYSSNFGIAEEAPLTAAAATQASANFPGGFPIRWLRSSRLNLRLPAAEGGAPRLLPLTDGGAYDNMGSQWFVNLESRRGYINERWPSPHPRRALTSPDLLCIANASALSKVSRPWTGLIPLVGEVAGLLQVKTVLYEQTTAPRRTALIRRFADPDDSLKGVMSHIASSPVKQLERFGDTEMMAVLVGNDPDIDWARRAEDNTKVRTALWPLGQIIVDLVHHAYVLTAVQFYLYCRMPLRLPPRSEFASLTEGASRPIDDHWHPARPGSDDAAE
jgi:hypothetical protein